MGPGCKNKCYLRKCNGPLQEHFQQDMFNKFWREGASEITQVRIVTTYLFNV